MIAPEQFLEECKNLGFNFFTGTPCSYLKPLINSVIDNENFTFIDSVNEGDAIAIAAGATIAGRKSVVMFQNSGLGNAVNPITSLLYTFKIPLLIIVTLRGNREGSIDEPQHELMGEITTKLLETMKLKWEYFPDSISDIKRILKIADRNISENKESFVLVMRKNDVSKWELKKEHLLHKHILKINHKDNFELTYSSRLIRTPVLEAVQKHFSNEAAIIATTGKTGRELFEIRDSENQFYMVGSMGCALPLGLGIALFKQNIKIIIIDGDGALLMRTGSMATVGAYAPKNLVHILLDNEAHDSTGGQATVSGQISFGGIAKSFGYKNCFSTDQFTELNKILKKIHSNENGPYFVHIKTKKGSPDNLGRPEITPEDVNIRFSKFLKSIKD